MSRRWIPASLVLIVALVAGGAMRLLLEDPGKTMTDAAVKFIGTLNDEAKQTAVLKYDDPTRLKWHFIPMPERKGLQVKNMTAAQRAAALELLRSALSQVGYHKATEIMSLEGILRELEKDRKGGPIRDPERYYYTLFGTPGAQGTWGLSVEGHHLSLNFVVRDGKVLAHTPAFFGANPATCRNEIAGYPKPGTRTLAKEEQLAFDLLGSLTDEQRKTVVRAEKAPADIRGPADSQPPQSAPEGIAVGKLNDAQQKDVEGARNRLCGQHARVGCRQAFGRDQRSGWDKVHFSWAGADKPGVGHYYRVQGPTFLIEFVNVQPDAAGNPANHIHSVWRDLRGDFGVSL